MDAFDVRRRDKDHVAFGHGVHRCVGEPLERLEAEAALPDLFGRFPGLRPAVPLEDLRPLPAFVFNGRTELPVHLESGPGAVRAVPGARGPVATVPSAGGLR